MLPESARIGNELREKPLGGFSRFSSEIFLRADILQAIRRERCYNEPEERGEEPVKNEPGTAVYDQELRLEAYRFHRR